MHKIDAFVYVGAQTLKAEHDHALGIEADRRLQLEHEVRRLQLQRKAADSELQVLREETARLQYGLLARGVPVDRNEGIASTGPEEDFLMTEGLEVMDSSPDGNSLRPRGRLDESSFGGLRLDGNGLRVRGIAADLTETRREVERLKQAAEILTADKNQVIA